jgi:hypothetical protein
MNMDVARASACSSGMRAAGGVLAPARRAKACATLVLMLVGCSAPEPSGVKAIVGARLSPAVEYSVVVVAEGKIRAAGPQSTTPVPKGAEITDGKGRVLSGAIEVGQPADLELRNASTGAVEAVMRRGEWVKK